MRRVFWILWVLVCASFFLLLLTSDGDKLAEFVRQYAEDPDAFSTVLTFHRVGPLENPPANSNP
jgi:hypothetical protein